ncbi:MAG: hypothetical protein E4H01_03665 [Lysobacterales bacterium]|nr:MAG: hypothetical protein E4H01_03665 [Xanthomonadales bacterium]
MADRGGQPGNKNAEGKRLFAHAIRRAVLADDGKLLRQIADALATKAATGDVPAIKELADRLDGKSVQALEHGGLDGAAAVSVTIAKQDSGA